MSDPVKVKMQLRAARPSIQGAAPASPAAAAAVEAVEARWRAEDKKAKSEQRKKRFVGCLSWLFLLLVALGVVWYFLGEKYLPPAYTFPRVWEQIKNGWKTPSPPPQNPQSDIVPVDPADGRTAAERAKIKDFVVQLEKLCTSDLPKRSGAVGIKTDAWAIGQAMLNEIVSADNWYFKAREKLGEMEAQNEKSQKLRTEERSARKGEYANQYRPHEINRQRNEVENKLESCKRIRVQAVGRAIKAIKSASAKWAGPESRKEAAQLLTRLGNLDKQLKETK